MLTWDSETADQTRTRARSGPSAPRMLVVDDLRLVRMTIAALLRREGFLVTEAASGTEGIRLLCEASFDLVFTDLRMPDHSGWDVARTARQLCPGLPVVLVTGSPELADAAPTLRELVDAVLPKPICPDTLLQVARDLTGLPEARRPA